MESSLNDILNEKLSTLPPIGLKDMKAVKLMNRTDQKYVTNVSGMLNLLSLVGNDYYVQEIDGVRISNYRTLYWDDAATHGFFRTHICGKLPRVKVRARTYVDSDLSFLEIKFKNNHGKTKKKRTQVASIDSVLHQLEGEGFLTEKTGLTFGDIRPTVGNRFSRITLVNKSMTERLTIDFGIRFDNQETGVDAEADGVVVIELKRDGLVFSPVLSKLRRLRIMPSGFSKYCIGTAMTNSSLPLGLLKERLQYVRRLTTE